MDKTLNGVSRLFVVLCQMDAVWGFENRRKYIAERLWNLQVI